MDKTRTRQILTLALPIIGGMISQNVLNLVDTLMVAQLGNTALAAVGLGGFTLFMCQAMILGIATGVQATAARRKGEGKHKQTAVALNGGIILVISLAIPLSALLFCIIPSLYPYLNNDPNVIKLGIPYLQISVVAIVFTGINCAFRGYWNAVNLSMLYLKTLLLMHTTNVILNYILIFGHLGMPAMGVNGAAWGTALSMFVGTCSHLYLGYRHARSAGFLQIKPSQKELSLLAKLSLPSGVQQFFFAAGFTILYKIIGSIGTSELAIANVLINITLVAILPGMALGLAAASLVGQSLGSNNITEASRWGWDVTRIGIFALGLLGLPMLITPELLLSPFLHDQNTLNLAIWPMRLIGFSIAFEAAGLVLMYALMGAGDTQRVMKVSIISQWIFFLPAAFVIGPLWGYGLHAVWALHIIYRSTQSLIFCWLWQQKKWAHISV